MEVMARYGNGVGDADVAWKMGRIMLKFRPIAPKPVTGGAVTGGGGVPAENSKAGAGGWGKRKLYGAREGKRGRKNKKVVAEEKSAAVVTLPLMPETPERKEEAPPSPIESAEGHVAVPYFRVPTWQRCSDDSKAAVVVVVAPRPVRPVGSWVTVEGVTDTWPVGGVVPCLEQDACPGFVSDEFDRVTWTNLAYRKMVVGNPDEEEEEEVEVRVALVTRGMVPAAGVTCFTCRVRVRYACRRRGKVSMAAPCDVWRLADGKLAWRLDVEAALCLALGTYKQNIQL